MNEDTRPNILWIVSEDCPPWLGCYGDERAHTPNLDALAARGVLYERAYSGSPVCAPSRFSLLTGIPAEAHAPADQMRARAEVPEWMRTYPEILRGRGYYCTNNAKTDYNAAVDADTIWDECSPSAHWRSRPGGAPFLAVFNYDKTHESSIFDAESTMGRGLAPFAKMLGDRRYAPGDLAPDGSIEKIDLPPYLPDTVEIRTDFAKYYTAIRGLDEFVGELLEQLDADGLADDTIVVYTSDHGGVMPRSKRYCYDEGLHVPLVIAAPPRLAHVAQPAGTRVGEPVSTVALAPTLLRFADVEPQSYMSEAALTAETVPADAVAFSQRGRMDERVDLVRTVRSRRYRYIRNYYPHRPAIQHSAFAWNAAGYRSWEREFLAGRLSNAHAQQWRSRPAVELYDLDVDPHETVNLAGNESVRDVEEALRARLRQHMLEINDNGFLAEGSPHSGWDASRNPGVYPLERILDVADLGMAADENSIPALSSALRDDNETVRRWAAFGLLRLAPAAPFEMTPELFAEAAEQLRAALTDEPGVATPAAEALARFTGHEIAYSTLAALADRVAPQPARLAALNALAALPTARVLPYREVALHAADEPVEYVSSAGRHLLLRLDGQYSPDADVFSVDVMLKGFMRARAGIPAGASGPGS